MLNRIRVILQGVLAVALAVGGAIGYLIPLAFPIPVTTHDLLVPHFYDGRVRVFWFHSIENPIELVQYGIPPTLRIFAAGEPPPSLPADAYGPNPPVTAWDARVQIGSRVTVPSFGGGWRLPMLSRQDLQRWRNQFQPPFPTLPGPFPAPKVLDCYFRLPVWLVTGLFLISPIRAAAIAIRERRRGRRCQCRQCGYNLTGNISGICSECGSPLTDEQIRQWFTCAKCGYDLRGTRNDECPECRQPGPTRLPYPPTSPPRDAS